MPVCKLIRLSPVPPKGYRYTQDLGKGVTKLFKGWEAITLAKEILSMRLANHLPRATYIEALEDVSVETCARLHCDPNYCSSGAMAQIITHPRATGGGCATCGKRKKR
jgi:hypothetical protein